MTKNEFLNELSFRLSTLPKAEIKKSLQYYDEIITDRMEDGMSEEEAVAALGNMGRIVEVIMFDMPFQTLIKARVNDSKSKSSNKWVWLILIILGSPVWFSLLIAFAAVVFSVYISIWSIIFSLYTVVLSLGVSCIAGIFAGIILCFVTSIPAGLCALGMAIICGSLTLFMIKPMFLITKRLVRLTALFAIKIKSLFIVKKGV